MNDTEEFGSAGFGGGDEGAPQQGAQPFGREPGIGSVGSNSQAQGSAQTAGAQPAGAYAAASATPGAAPVAFCGSCGRPLSAETMRVVGAAAYCEPCLLARLGTPIGPPPPTAWSASMNSGEPNPGLAALLGLIPGVGAMYNGQYGKGVVHLIVFVAFVQLADWVGVFGLFVAGWIFYMAIEAHHTARARRDGTPLPNPFGLNDVGERLGFGRNWPAGPGPAAVASDAAYAAAQEFRGAGAAFNPARPPYASVAPGWPPAAATGPGAGIPDLRTDPGWGAPVDSGATPGGAGPQGFPSGPYAAPPYSAAPYSAPPSWTGAAPEVPTAFASAPVVPLVPEPVLRSRFPAGAVLLIGLGTLFMLHTSGVLHGFAPGAVVGLGLIGLGVWLFARRLLSVPVNPYAPEADNQLRALQAVRDAGPVTLLGVLNLLNGLHIWPWSRSWPFAIIFAGLLLLAHRAIANTLATSAAAERLRAYEAGAGAVPGAWTADAPSSAVPAPRSTEGGL